MENRAGGERIMSGPVLHLAGNELDDAIKKLYGWKWGAERALKDALYRTGDGLKTDAVNETKQRYYLSASEIRKHLAFKKGGGSGYHTVTLTAIGHSKRISDYKVTGRGQNIKVAVKREGGMKTLKTAFLRDYHGRMFVLWHPPGVSGPARRLFSPSVPQVIKNKETVAAMEKGAGERFKKRLDHNIERMIKGSWRG
jgi:hypothetical protein